jgi:hypothetical protein
LLVACCDKDGQVGGGTLVSGVYEASMKKLFWIIGAVVCLALIVAAMYVALTIGLSVFIAYTNQMKGRAYAAQQAQTQADQMKKGIEAWGKNPTPNQYEAKRDADELSGKVPSLFADPEGYQTEDNWLASMISREIAEMSFMAAHPGAALPEIKAMAVVDPAVPQVQVEINGFNGEGGLAVSADLTPVFAWDPAGYTPLAQTLLGSTPGVPAEPETDANNVLGHLLNLTGPTIAQEDVRISAALQEHPASWQDHEAAALVLMALALREHAGTYSEKRPMLCRATAHLAVASALRGNQTASWPGLIAGAAIRTLSGREIDALAHLDNLSAQADLPEAAKPWIATLRMVAKQDWRTEVTEKSPLLLKFAWYDVLEFDLRQQLAADRIKQVVPQPPEDPNLPPDQQKTNPETLLPDWGRIAGRSPFYDDADDDAKNAEYRLGLEFRELDEILKIEGSTPFDLNNLATVYSEAETDTVSTDAAGKTVVHVIGAGGFKAASRRHVFAGMLAKRVIPDSNLPDQDPAQAQNLFTKFDGLLKGVPGYEVARLQQGFLDSDEIQKQYDQWGAAKKTWRPWEVPYVFALEMPGHVFIKKFYRRPVPFGTVYEPDVGERYGLINDMTPVTWPPFDTPELEAIKKLPPQQANDALGDYNRKYNEALQKLLPHSPTPFEQELLKLDPDCYDLAQDHWPDDKLITAVPRFLDYCVNPVWRIENLDAAHLSDADRITVMRKHVAFDPGFGFRAGVVLRSKGLMEEAAAMDREAFASGQDPIAISDQTLPLVAYALDHGLNDEALKVAKFSGDVASQMGLGCYCYALERLGKLDEAEAAAKQDIDMYSDESWMFGLQMRHRDRYPGLYDAALARAYPSGLVQAKLADFSGKPQNGDQVKTDSDTSKMAGLQIGDVIVGLDGYRVSSDLQYDFVRSLSLDSKMDFIVWRNDKYLELHAVVPGRRMWIDIGDYVAN